MHQPFETRSLRIYMPHWPQIYFFLYFVEYSKKYHTKVVDLIEIYTSCLILILLRWAQIFELFYIS